ncbi:MAG: HD domain-containing protein [Asgard group archaeon]|nr:HD domain-containing protein [Asgard group archaeon]
MFFEDEWPKPEARKGLPVWRLNRILTIIQTKTKNLTNDDRLFNLTWSFMHMYGSMQIGKLLALKRGIDPELAAITCAFHDIYTLLEGKGRDHALKAEKYIRQIIAEYNNKWRQELPPITSDELTRIVEAIKTHSDKKTKSTDPLAELLKDVDTLDSYLHGLSQDNISGRITRGNTVLEELNLAHKIKE